MRKRTYREATAYYDERRLSAYAAATAQLVAQGFGPDIRLTDAGARALTMWRQQWTSPHPSGSGGWDWEAIAAHARRDPTRYTLAIWSGTTLCGLASGSVSTRNASGARAAITLQDLEANPDPQHPLKGKVGFIATFVAEAYGSVLGARIVRLVDPLPGALRVYVPLGFTVVWMGDRPVYCEREILR